MTKLEFDRLWGALSTFWPKERLSQNQKSAWWLALEPFPYHDGVRDNLMAYVRSAKGNYFPDVADLTRGLVSEEPYELDWMDAYMDATYVSNPVTHYAATHGGTIGEAEAALGISWEEAQEGASRDI